MSWSLFLTNTHAHISGKKISIFFRSIKSYRVLRKSKSWRIIREIGPSSLLILFPLCPPSVSPFFFRITTRGSRIRVRRSRDFGQLLLSSDTCEGPVDKKGEPKGRARRAGGKVRGRGRKEKKEGYAQREKKEAKKMKRIPRGWGRPVRLVLDLKPVEYPSSFYSIFTPVRSFTPCRCEKTPLRHRDRFRSAFKGVACATVRW